MVFFRRSGRNNRRFTRGRRKFRKFGNGFAKMGARALASKALSIAKHVAVTRPKPETIYFQPPAVSDATINSAGTLKIPMNNVLQADRNGLKIKEVYLKVRFKLKAVIGIQTSAFIPESGINIILIRWNSLYDVDMKPNLTSIYEDTVNMTSSFYVQPKDAAWAQPYTILWRKDVNIAPRQRDGGTSGTDSLYRGTQSTLGNSATKYIEIDMPITDVVTFDPTDTSVIAEGGMSLWISNNNDSIAGVLMEDFRCRYMFSDA